MYRPILWAASLGTTIQCACATRRSVVSMTVGEQAMARFKREETRMLREAEEIHKAASNITLDAARKVLSEGSAATATLMSVIDEHLFANNATRGQLRRTSQGLVQKSSPTSGGIAKARLMLNNMIIENRRKLDNTKTECSEFFEKQCSLMATCRSDIASSNSEAAMWRSKVLFAQKEINICEFRLPHLKVDLAINIHQCNTRLGQLRRDLKIVMWDIEVMKKVLKLTECPAKLIQMEQSHIVECKHPCTKKSFLAFHRDELNAELAKMKSPAMRALVQKSLRQLVSPVEKSSVPVDENGTVIVNITNFENPPLSQEPLPADPCKGITYDAGGVAGCTLRTNPKCFNLQNKFLNIQGETVDKRNELLASIRDLLYSCARTQKTLRGQISYFETRHDENAELLAEGTSGENEATATASEKGQEHRDLEHTMFENRKDCTTTMRTLESELCALRRIRGELMKLKGDKHPFLQDCEVAKWEAEDCSVSCGGGIQFLRRAIVSPMSNGGAPCPPLGMHKGCNQQPCPIDCKVSRWSRFSACSAECGGGIRERTRSVKVNPRYGGEPCGDLSETESCNVQDCNRDCTLGHWGKYKACSKACGGGFQYSKRTIKVAAVGNGKCPKAKSSARQRRRPCNVQPCPTKNNTVLSCKTKVDLVLALDGSGSIGQYGWAKTKEFAKRFVDAFDGQPSQVSIILFSGPRTWDDYDKCNGPNSPSTDAEQESICGMKMVQHFSNDTKATKANIDALAFPSASTYTAKALEMADAELTLGRSDATRVVLVMTDGIPISIDNTALAAKKLRKRARLMFGAVKLDSDSLGHMQSWASTPVRDNVLRIADFETMASLATMNNLVRDMCEEVFMEMNMR